MHVGENRPWGVSGQLRAGARMLSLRDLHLPHFHISRGASGKCPAILPGSVGRDGWQWWQGGGKRFESVCPCHVRDLRLDPLVSARWPRPAGDFRDYLFPRSDASVRPPMPAADAFAEMVTEAARSVVDQGHTAESVLAPPQAPAAPAAEAPTAPPVPPVAAAPSTAPVQLASAPPPSFPLPLGALAPDAPAPVAPQPPAASPLVQAAAGVPAPGTAVGAAHDPAHLVALASAPVQPVAHQRAESHSRGVAGGSAAAHRGRGSPRRRPSPSYRNAHRGGRGGWWGGHGRGREAPSEMQQLRDDFPGMLAAAMREALNSASTPGGSLAAAAAAHASAPVAAQAPPAPHAVPAPSAQAYPQGPGPAVGRAPPPASRPGSAAPYPPLPWIPPVPGTGFVGAGGGEARGPFRPPRRIDEVPAVPPPPALPVPAAARLTGTAEVPTATLAQLWRLVECQQALTLILVNSHFAILRNSGSTLDPMARADCLAAAA
ncbi:unnamed protein product [Closterium sp. Naga37s-1]|nr:unnamed protein product [Closterium sp. Naga37s-1]